MHGWTAEGPNIAGQECRRVRFLRSGKTERLSRLRLSAASLSNSVATFGKWCCT